MYVLNKKLFFAFIAILLCTRCFGATTSGDCVYNINESLFSLSLHDTCSVNLNDGANVPFFDLYDQAQANHFGGSEVGFFNLYDQAQASLYDDASAISITLHDETLANIYDDVAVVQLDLYDQSHANLYGGELDWMRLNGQSSASLYQIDLGLLLLDQHVEVTIYGSGFSYVNGYLNGFWADGSSFSFEAIYMDDMGMIDEYYTMPSNIILAQVPAPPALVLLVSGLLALFHLKYKTA